MSITTPNLSRSDAVPLEYLDECLSDPSFYPGSNHPVERVETHASLVYLTGDDVYKLKKPVDFGFLDYSTLTRRRLMCKLEVQLNRRLAPSVYFRTIPLTLDARKVQLAGRGTIVDYLVHMRRLPHGTTLAAMIEDDAIGYPEIDQIAKRLGSFHLEAERGPEIDRWGLPAMIRRNVDENFSQTRAIVGDSLTKSAFDTISTYAREFLVEHRGMLNERVLRGMIRDGHGDIRCEHVYLLDPITIIDCIEFNDRLRFGDIAADVGFLAMDLDARNRPDLSDRLVSTYSGQTGFDLLPVLDFYRCYRAFVRGKVALLSMNGGPSEAVHFRDARRHFHLAQRYANGNRGPRLLVMCGLSGTGKSTIAETLAATLPARKVDSDSTRKRMAGLDPSSRRDVAVDEGIYSPAHSRRVYQELLDQAERELKLGRTMILDATYIRMDAREAAKLTAAKYGAEFLIIHCQVDSATVKDRLAKRSDHPSRVSDGRWEIYLAQQKAFEEFAPSERAAVLELDTAQSVEDQTQVIFSRLERLPGT